MNDRRPDESPTEEYERRRAAERAVATEAVAVWARLSICLHFLAPALLGFG